MNHKYFIPLMLMHDGPTVFRTPDCHFSVRPVCVSLALRVCVFELFKLHDDKRHIGGLEMGFERNLESTYGSGLARNMCPEPILETTTRCSRSSLGTSSVRAV